MPPSSAGPWRAWTAAALLAALWLGVRRMPVGWIDGLWLQQAYPLLSRGSALLQESMPISPTLLGALLLAALLALGCWRVLRRRPAPGRAWLGRWSSLLALLVIGATALGLAFELNWGLAYRRTPVQTLLGLPDRAPNASDLRLAFERLADIAWQTEAAAIAASGGVAGDPPRSEDLQAAAGCVAELDRLLSGRPAPLRLPGQVTVLPPGTLLRGGFAGLHLPWWREPSVDGGLPPVAALATATHELVHAAGWAREAETDAIAVLAGLRCQHQPLRFASAVHGLGLLWNEVQRTVGAGDLERQAVVRLREALPPAVEAAWRAEREAQARHLDAGFARGNQAVYDRYLRAQGVEAGMADYGRAVVLLSAMLAQGVDRWSLPPEP